MMLEVFQFVRDWKKKKKKIKSERLNGDKEKPRWLRYFNGNNKVKETKVKKKTEGEREIWWNYEISDLVKPIRTVDAVF